MLSDAFRRWMNRANFQNVSNLQLNLSYIRNLLKAFKAGWKMHEKTMLKDPEAIIKKVVKEKLLTSSEIRAVFAAQRTGVELAYQTRALSIYQDEGTCEIDEDALVSPSETGAYVQAWVWVPMEDLSPAMQARAKRELDGDDNV